MFKISPIQEAQKQELYAKMCGAEYKEGYFAYGMKDVESGELMGFSQFEITESGGRLLNLCPAPGIDDYEAMFILGRATMNFIDLCGTHTLSASDDAAVPALLRAIGLRLQDNGTYFCDMTGFFDGSHCSGHK